jgi:ATP-dependent RNA helicase DDX35
MKYTCQSDAIYRTEIMAKKQNIDHQGFWIPSGYSGDGKHSDSINVMQEESFPNSRSSSSSSGLPFNFSENPIHIQRQCLPITKHRTQILYALEHYSVVVIVGETGSGKSTQIPQFLYETGYCDDGFSVVCTQPRRIAAQTLAQRVSIEMGSDLGSICGYRVQFDRRTSAETCILFATDGMLLREAYLHDPLLSRYSVIMIDEAHELNCNTELLLGLVKKIRKKRKDDLKLIICSATIDAQVFLDFFLPKRIRNETDSEQNNSTIENRGTIISIDGRQHPVDIFYVKEPVSDYVKATVDTAFKIHFDKQEGDILCFLTTGEEIDSAIKYAEEILPRNLDTAPLHKRYIDFLPLYGTLPYHVQSRVFQPKSNLNHRRVIFATNIAETSVTVPYIRHVIDSGFVKLPYFDDKSGFDRLIVCPTSKSSAQQRAGRAGRIGYGKCYRLYKEADMASNMEDHSPPEILRSNLSSTILTLKNMGIHNILGFDMINVPPITTISHALETLYALGAIDEKTHLTKLGQQMSEFPTDPHVSRMLLESLQMGCSQEVLSVAAALQVLALLYQPRTPKQQIDYDDSIQDILDTKSDHVTYVNLFKLHQRSPLSKRDCDERFVNYMALKRSCEIRSQLSRFLRKYGRVQGMDFGQHEQEVSEAVRKCLTAGYFSHTAKLGNDGRYYSLKGGHMVSISSSSVLNKYGMGDQYIIFTETYDGSRGGLEVRGVSVVEGKWLLEMAPHYFDF